MSKPAIAVFAVAAVAAGGYSAYWFKKSEDFKQQMITNITELNAKVKPLIKDGEFLRYESVQSSGYPFAMKLTLTKPVMQLPASAIMKQAPKESWKGDISPEFEWTEELGWGDSVSLSSDVLGSKFEATLNGDIHWKTTAGGTVRHTMVASSATPLTCELKTKPSGFLVTYPQFKDAESFFEAFEAINCGSSASVIKDATGATIATTDSYRLGITNVINAGHRNAGLKYQVINNEYLAAGDIIVTNYMNIVAEAFKQTPQKLTYSLSEMGKNNINVDIAYNGPDNAAAIDNPNSRLSLDINALDLNSNLLNSNNNLHLLIEPQGDNRRIALKSDSKTNISERYDQILADNIKLTLTDLASTEGKTGKELDIAHSVQKFGSIDSLVEAALPKLHKQGDITLHVDMEAVGKKLADSSEGQAKISAFDILTSLYGVKLKGDLAAIKNQSAASNVDITCLSCDTMIDDIARYFIRFASYINTVAPDTRTPVASPDLANGVKTFIRSVALNGSDPAAKDLNIQLVMKESGDFTVSGKPVTEAMQSYMTNVVPHLPREETPSIPPEQMPPEFREQMLNPSAQ